MNRYLLALCFGSAVLGGLVALAVREAPWLEVLPAQEFGPPTRLPPGPDQNTAFADPNTTHSGGIPPGIAESAGTELTAEERVNIAVYENVNRSVVNINTKGVRGESFFLIEIPSEGAGSGSVLDQQGHILTNYHVIEGAREIQVTLFDGKEYSPSW